MGDGATPQQLEQWRKDAEHKSEGELRKQIDVLRNAVGDVKKNKVDPRRAQAQIGVLEEVLNKRAQFSEDFGKAR